MAQQHFFEKATPSSKVKTQLVSKYFWMWLKVIIPHAKKRDNKIAYIDLFSGPGKYKEGDDSTPIAILKSAIEDPNLQQMLVAYFNDTNTNHVKALKENINALNDIDKLKYKPSVNNETVGENIAKSLADITLIPSLVFVDPWGYSGLSINLIGSVIKDWGCDCIFFFNYNRINSGLANPMFMHGKINDVFGADNTNKLRKRLKGLKPAERETTVLNFLKYSLKNVQGNYMLAMRFKSKDKGKTSHFLILVSKNPLAYALMKKLMVEVCTDFVPAIEAFEFNPRRQSQQSLFKIAPIDELAEDLLVKFSRRKLKMKDVYIEHNMGTPYIEKHYKEALLKLEAKGVIKTESKKKRRKNTIGDDVIVIFPSS